MTRMVNEQPEFAAIIKMFVRELNPNDVVN
jgi:hypothetical protein